MTIEEKINIITEVANRFCQYNVRPIAITGSLLLYKLGINIEREPGDLDLVVALYDNEHEEDAIKSIELPSDLEIISISDSSSEYDCAYEVEYKGFNFKVDFLISKENFQLIDDSLYGDLDSLIKYKTYLSKHASPPNKRQKHIDDLIKIEEYINKEQTSCQDS